jgi:hypothetical protein
MRMVESYAAARGFSKNDLCSAPATKGSMNRAALLKRMYDPSGTFDFSDTDRQPGSFN